MAGVSRLFLETKKKPAPTGEEDGLISPAAKESLMYFSIANLSGLERLHKGLEGRVEPGINKVDEGGEKGLEYC